jgi:hypothetical protein
MRNKLRLMVGVLALVAVASAAAQLGLAGKWTGVDQNDHPVTLELVVKGEEATGTLALCLRCGPRTVLRSCHRQVPSTTK